MNPLVDLLKRYLQNHCEHADAEGMSGLCECQLCQDTRKALETHFTIVFEPEQSGTISAYVTGLPVYAQGATQRQAAQAIRDTLTAYLEALEMKTPPRPSAFTGVFLDQS
jgi:predicted RNase H-like HicB family nuclease